jgi:hypothetical protein
MRVESSVTAISWIPSQMIEGLARVPFTVGVTHPDPALIAATACKLAVVDPDALDMWCLDALSREHRREHERSADAPDS